MKKKSFREQMQVVVENRYKHDDAECKKRHLDEATTPAAEALITYIRQWPDQHRSRNQALGRLLECDRWNGKGELVLERNFKGKPYPLELPLEMAYESYMYGDQRRQFIPSYSFASALKRIPENMTEDWAEEIKGLFGDLNRMSLTAFKLISLGRWVKMYGTSNPHTFAGWDREVKEWQEAQTAIDAFVVTRKGWEYLTTENLQNPKHKAEMSMVLTDILANADAIVEPCLKAIREQDRRLYIRQDATQARNNVKSLKKFFGKYAQPEVNALTLVGGIIDDVEEKTLATPTKS